MVMGRGGATLFELAREVKPSEAHMKKIMKDKALAELALTDPRRDSGRPGVLCKQELEQMVETLTKRISTLSEELSKHLQIRTENSELKIKLRSMEEMSQLRKAQQEALTSEVKVWKAKYNAMLSHKLNTSCQERKR
ncbi:bZIP transcription factor 30-like [Aegilops tauschii subsp. strangulata]|uniref:bZIP transcription factor 30-like n=1 Tax=Aegilops tauschii subsp. strangulata TaxID=200361 RepID=UPI003CC8562A